jgi:HK97 family phage major capsid protein
MTKEEKEAAKKQRKADRNARRESRKALIAKGGNDAMIATLENVVDTLEERTEEIPEGMEELREGLEHTKVDVQDLRKRLLTRGGGKTTEGMDVKKFNVGKLALGFVSGRFEDSSEGVGYELEALEAMYSEKGFRDSQGREGLKKKDILTSLQGSAGALPLPVQVSQDIREAARSNSVLFGMGVVNDSLEGLSAFSVPYEVQKDGKTDVTTGINMQPGTVQEGGAYTTARPGFRLANFTPRKLGVIVGMTDDIMKQGGQFLHAFIQRTAAKDMRNQLERFAFSGRGQQFGEPMGILGRSDLSTINLGLAMATNGRFITPSDFRDFEMDLAEVDRLSDNFQFVTRPAGLRNLAHESATQALAGATEANSLPRSPMAFMNYKKIAEFLGIKLNMTTNVPKNFVQGSTTDTTALLAGDFTNMWIPFWGPMEMLMSREATVGGVSAFETALMYIRFSQMYDVNVIDPKAFAVKKGFLTH